MASEEAIFTTLGVSTGEEITDEELAEMISSADLDEDGLVREEILSMMELEAGTFVSRGTHVALTLRSGCDRASSGERGGVSARAEAANEQSSGSWVGDWEWLRGWRGRRRASARACGGNVRNG